MRDGMPDATTAERDIPPRADGCRRTPALWAFVAAMVLFHAANAPGGVYLGLFLKRDLHAPERMLAYAFVVSMVAWMLVVWPAGWLADRWGRKPLLIAGWAIMAVRLALVAVVQTPGHGRREPGARRPGQRPVRRAGRRLGDRPPGRPAAVGRGAGDRRLVPGARLGDRPGGGGLPRRAARLPGPVRGPGGRRCRRDGDRRVLSSPRPWPGTTSSSMAEPSTRWPRRPTSRRSRDGSATPSIQ